MHPQESPSRLGRRPLLAGAGYAALATPCDASRDALRRHLPAGVDPAVVGREMRRTLGLSASECARMAMGCVPHLAMQSAADFAAGNTVMVAGWMLSRTEALLCAGLS